MSSSQSLFAIIASPKRRLFSRLGLMLLPVMLLASGCQNRPLQPVLIGPEEWYRGIISEDQGEVDRALERACFLNVTTDVMARIREPRGRVELVEELPAKASEGWTPLKVRMVVGGQEILIDRHLTKPYMIYSDKVDRMLGIDPESEARAIRSSQPYCFNILTGDDDSSGDN